MVSADGRAVRNRRRAGGRERIKRRRWNMIRRRGMADRGCRGERKRGSVPFRSGQDSGTQRTERIAGLGRKRAVRRTENLCCVSGDRMVMQTRMQKSVQGKRQRADQKKIKVERNLFHSLSPFRNPAMNAAANSTRRIWLPNAAGMNPADANASISELT